MCDIATLGGIALTGLSTGLNYAASQRVESARDDAMAAENLRQKMLDREASAINQDTRKSYKKFDQKTATRKEELADYFTGQSADVPAEAALPTSASNVTVQAEDAALAKAKAFTDKSGEALAGLRSFGDLMGDQAINQAQDASKVAQIGGFKTGSSNILPYELEDANKAGDGLKLFGDILGGFGGMVLQKGLTAPGAAPAASAFPAPPAGVLATPGSFGDLLGKPSSMGFGRVLDIKSVPGYAAVG